MSSTPPNDTSTEQAQPSSDLARLRTLRAWLERVDRGEDLDDAEWRELPRAYRHASSVVARLEASGQRPRLAAGAKRLVADAHRLIYRERQVSKLNPLQRLYRLYAQQCPRAIRSEWRLVCLSLVLVYGLALVSWFAVSRDLDLAPSLLDPGVVAGEIEQLQKARELGEPFRGNFTFGVEESPTTAVMLMLNNIRVSLMFFTSALIPPLYAYVLSSNSLMLGTYTAVAGHWGAAGEISSILWCHGVLEIQAIILSGVAGLVLARGIIRPGRWTRKHALKMETRRGLILIAPMFPMLILAGLIEGFISPHAPTPVRLSVALATGVLLLAWVLFAGREPQEGPPEDPRISLAGNPAQA